MIARETIQIDLVKPFSLRERMHVLFGKQLRMAARVEVTAKANIRRKEVTITSEYKGVQAFYGVAEKPAPIEQMGPGF